ncbi:MAG: M20 aminoacylase family protein [Collimonas sp.]|uniref:M20 aminoacylase family protein n=1 Tax=Collimonas sp. TaxID=1963772 RepID=UPI0032645A37
MQLVDFPHLDQLIALRRDIHAHPELAYEERRTAELVATTLESWGIAVTRGIGKTGVVATLSNGNSKRAISLRADMDALPMQEENTMPHRSRHDGCMHACGHDGHTVMMLAAACHLQATRQFDGTVNFIFQPAEEGGNGALAMVNDGLFERFPCDAIFGMHNWPGLPVGAFVAEPGGREASCSRFTITVHGKGGHVGTPHVTTEALLAVAQIATQIQNIVARNLSPTDPAVVSVTRLQAGSAFNVIPDSAWLGGSVRTYDEHVLRKIEERLRHIAEHVAHSYECRMEFVFTREMPAVINDSAEAARCQRVIEGWLGEQALVALPPLMTSEDFSFMLNERPGCYVLIGNGNDEHRAQYDLLGPCSLHNPHYDFNDALISLGGSFWVRLVEDYLPVS